MVMDPTMQPIEPWSGPWPPDPSWDTPVLPPPAESPVPDAAFAPLPPAAPPPPDVPVAPAPGAPPVPPVEVPPWDADLIQLEPNVAGPEAPPPAQSAQPEPWDANLIELDPGVPQAPPNQFAPTDEERLAALGRPEAVDALRNMDPEAFAIIEAKHQIAAEDEAATKRAAAAAADRQAAEDNERIHREAVASTRTQLDAISAERDRLASEKVDPDGWMNSRNTFQKISAFVSAIVGGLVQSRQGGQNQGLAMINDAIERHIDAQKANLANRRDMLARREGAVREDAARAEQDFATEEAFRQAAWKRTLDQIETERQGYDPAGTRNLRLAGVSRDIQSKMAASQQALADAALKKNIELGKYQLELDKFAEEKRKNRAAEARAAAAASATSASNRKYTPAELKQLFPGQRVPPDGSWTIGGYNQWQEGAMKGRQLNEPTEGEKLARSDAKEARSMTLLNPVAMGTGKGVVDRTFRDFNGEPSKIDSEMAKKIRPQISAMATLSKLAAEQRALIEKHGGELNPRSDAAKLYKSNSATIANLLRKGYDMGTLDEGAKRIADDVQGGDPSKFIGDADVGLENMVHQAELLLDSDLKAAGWNPAEGEMFKLPRYQAPVAKRDEDYDAAIQQSSNAPDVSLTEAATTPAGKRRVDAAVGRALTDDQEKGIVALTKRAATDQDALKMLAAVAKEADNPAAKAAAAAALSDLEKRGIKVAKGDPGAD